MYDPDRASDDHDRQREAALKRRPLCQICDEHIEDDDAYCIDGLWYCPECIANTLKEVPLDY